LFSEFCLTRIILRPLSALSLDEGLNAVNGKNPSTALWFRRTIKCQILASARSINKWISKISSETAKQIDKVCDKLYNKYGYKSFDEI
jgi:hypothetical protein